MKTLTVAQLRDLLDGEDDDARVIFCADYGDISHTQQALPIRGDVEEVQIEESAYSTSGFAIADEDEDNGDDQNRFLVIR